MKPGAIVASTPAWNESAELLERCRRSVAGVVDEHHVYAGGIARLTEGPWATQAAMRDHGRAWAQRRGARWLLQLDADELLINGELLRPILERWPWPAYPLPLVQEHDGQTTLAPFKLFRLPARIVACSEYVQLSNGRGARSSVVYNLAGYSCPPELRGALLELPFLLHTPHRRRGIRAGARLSYEELAVESRPADAVQWPLPPLTLTRRPTMAVEDEGGSIIEHEAKDGEYACPGCGSRYDTPGICEGHGEAGHEPIPVERVKGEKVKGEKQAPAADGPSVRELRAEAAKLGISGASKLSKAKLVAAVAEHKAGAAA